MINFTSGDQIESRTQALKVLTDHGNLVLADRTSAVKMQEDSLLAMMAVDWSPRITTAIGSRPLNRLFHRIWNEVFDREEYIIFRDMIIYAADDAIPLEHTQWNLWRTLMARHRLFEITDMRHWVSLVARLDTRGIRTPFCLQRVPFRELSAVDWEVEYPDMLLMMWQAARLEATPHRRAPPAADSVDFESFRSMIMSLRHDSIHDTGVARDYAAMKEELSPPPDYELLSMANKCTSLANCGAGNFRIHRFLDLGAKRNTLRAFACSLRPAASGMQSYLNFCPFMQRPTFPVCSDAVLLWSATFRPGRTFAQYIAHLTKASILMRQPTDWLVPDVRAVSRGLKQAQDLSFRFQNYILAGDLLRLLRARQLSTPFGQAAFLSFLFLFRVPSETLLLVRGGQADRIAEFSPPTDEDSHRHPDR